MGFQLFKKRDSAAKPSSSSSSSGQQPPYPRLPSSSSSTTSNSYTPPAHERTTSSSNLFTNAFRSSSSRDRQHPPPLPPAQPSYASSSSTTSGSSRVLRVDTQNVRQQHGEESWDDLGVPLRSGNNLSVPSPTSTLGPPDRRSVFEGRAHSDGRNRTVSLPLGMDDREPDKKSRWTLGRGPNRRAGSTSSTISTVGVADRDQAKGKKEGDKHGFVVRSFRSVSRVQEDPISRGPYESLPYASPHNNLAAIAASPPLPPLPFFESNSAPPQRPALNIRAPAANNWRDAERAPSPTISVEGELCSSPPQALLIQIPTAFRLASARSKSSVSLQSMSSFDTAPVERPRFEPTRSRRSSTHIEPIPSPLAPPRPQFAGHYTSAPHSGASSVTSSSSFDHDSAGGAASQHMGPGLSGSGSLASVGSYQTASEGGIDDEKRDRRVSRRISDGWNDELRLIAMYGADLREDDDSPPLEVKHLPPPRQVFPTTDRSPPFESTPRPNPSRPASRSAPSLSLQPATPSRPSSSALKAPALRPISSPSIAPSSTAANKGKAPVRRAWTSDSSDEDDVPLARLSHVRSSSTIEQVRPTDVGGATLQKTGSSELEVLETDSRTKTSSSVSHSSQSVPGLAESEGPTRSALGGSEESISRRSTQRRSMSTLSFSTSSAPPASSTTPTFSRDSPTLGHRTYSNPASPVVGAAPFSATDLPLLPSLTSTVFDQRNSSSSSSGSGSGSSLPQTPKDNTPATSILGVGAKSTERLVKFDTQSLGNDADRRWSSRMSTAPVSRSSIAVPSFGSPQQRPASMVGFSTPQSTKGRRPPFVQQHQGSRSVDQLSQMSSNAPGRDDVYGRMRARHQAETLDGLAIGKDLNGGGRIRDDEDENEDDDAPLASLPSRGGGARSQGGSMYGGYQQQPFFPPPSSVGGYSQLHNAPPGVDPYLYASLPPDQKMGLHHRAQQMMTMMAQAAEQAKAESVAGWESGSSTGSEGGKRNSGRRSVGDMSMLGGGTSPSMGNGFGYPMPMPGGRLPPFAPSLRMSQTFFNEVPSYAGSAMGYAGSQSVLGVPTGRSGGQQQQRGSASVIGTGRR